MTVGRAGIVTAWLFGLGLVSYRYITRLHQPPIPGSLLAASGFFALLAVVAEYPPAAAPAAAVGWGVDLAALLNLLPASVAGPSSSTTSSATSRKATGTTQAPGTATAGGRG